MNARPRSPSLTSSRLLRRLALSSVLLVGAALAWTAAQAQTAPAAPQPTSDPVSKMRLSSAQVQQAFRFIDRDGSGNLSRSEIAVYPRIEKHFDRIDTDRDGTVSPDEFENAVQQAS